MTDRDTQPQKTRTIHGYVSEDSGAVDQEPRDWAAYVAERAAEFFGCEVTVEYAHTWGASDQDGTEIDDWCNLTNLWWEELCSDPDHEQWITTTTYYCDDGNCEVEIDAATPRAAAEAYVAGGDWADTGQSLAVRVLVWTDDRGDGDSHIVLVHPALPPCTEPTHAWRELSDGRGVIGGPGCSVLVTEVCSHCGLVRSERGPSQGVESEHDHTVIKYTPGADYQEED